MSRVNIICRGYQGAYQHLNGTHNIDVSYWKFNAASLTLGFQRFSDFIQAGPRMWKHRIGQSLSGAAYLGDANGNLCLTSGHDDLDASEKGNMSYWQGMVLAKLAAAEILGIRWLQHADAMEKRRQLHRNSGLNINRRADMAGQDDQGGWHVIEAKGFSSHPGLPAFASAKAQAGMVTSINQTAPETTSACVASLWKTPIEILLDDPTPFGNEQWSVEDSDFWDHYYGGIADYIRNAERPTRLPSYPHFTFASLSPLLGMMPPMGHFSHWKTGSIGLPDKLIEDVKAAPRIVPRVLSGNPLERVLDDGIAVVGTASEFQFIG